MAVRNVVRKGSWSDSTIMSLLGKLCHHFLKVCPILGKLCHYLENYVNFRKIMSLLGKLCNFFWYICRFKQWHCAVWPAALLDKHFFENDPLAELKKITSCKKFYLFRKIVKNAKWWSKSNLPLSHSPDRKIFPFKKGFKKYSAETFFSYVLLNSKPLLQI